MSSLLAFAVGLGASQALLLLCLLLNPPRYSRQTGFLSLLLLCVLAYFTAPLFSFPGSALLQNLIPGAIFLLCHSVFTDQLRLQPWQLLLVACSVILPALGTLLGDNSSLASRALVDWLPQSIEFVLLIMALAVVAQYWSSDLLQSRRRMRVVFCGLVAAYSLILIASRELLFSGNDTFNLVQYGISAAFLLFLNTQLMRFPKTVRQELLGDSAPCAAVPGSSAAAGGASSSPAPSSELLSGLAQLMEQDAVYRELGLSIGQLAARLEVPEYKLRQAINTGLGYRNFNDFLNSYRIREATERLISEQEQTVPVLSIALDVGFRSLSSFNKAFKDTHGLTPTEFRKQHIKHPD